MMHVYIVADHRGFRLKKELLQYLALKKYIVEDLGNKTHDTQDDFPDFVSKLANTMQSDDDRGIVICGSGVGVCIAANRYPHIRCALGFDTKQIASARQDDAINTLALAADFTSFDMAKQYVDIFLSTQFKNEEKYIRRINKINEHAYGNCSSCTCHH